MPALGLETTRQSHPRVGFANPGLEAATPLGFDGYRGLTDTVDGTNTGVDGYRGLTDTGGYGHGLTDTGVKGHELAA